MTQTEVEAIVQEENAAMMEFSAISRKETDIGLKKKAARHRLMLARAAKRALVDEIMSV